MGEKIYEQPTDASRPIMDENAQRVYEIIAAWQTENDESLKASREASPNGILDGELGC